MTHRMILATADLKTIYKVVVARRKVDAGVAQAAERRFRKPEVRSSSDLASPSLEENDDEKRSVVAE